MSTFRQGRVRRSTAFSFAAGVVLLAQLTLAPSLVSAGEFGAFCDYDGTNHQARVTINGSNASAQLQRAANGYITVNGLWCDGAATVTNTDSILVIGGFEDQTLYISLANGAFRPGRANEAGKSDEIEITVNLGNGSQDGVQVLFTDVAQNIVLGQKQTQFGIVRWLNLNAGESTGVDGDLAMIGVENLTVFGFGGNDRVRARGGFGTGDVLGLPLFVYGGLGNDEIRGGSGGDHLYANEGNDKLWGYAGGDSLYMQDGVQGNDFGRGGSGDDYCFLDFNDDCDV